MKKSSLLFALLCVSVMGWATQYCSKVVTTTIDYTSLDVTVTVKKLNSTTARVILDNEHITGIRAGGTFQQWGNGVWVDQAQGVANFASGWTHDGNAWYKDFEFSTYPTTGNFQIYILMDHDAGTPAVAGFTLAGVDVDAECSGGGADPFDPTSVDWTSSVNTTTYYKVNDQFQIAAENAANMPTGPLNIQQPAWAAFEGLYVEVPAGVSACAFDDVAVTDGTEYDGNTGAGIVLNPSALTNAITKVTVTHGLGTTTFYVHNANAGSGDPEPTEIYDVNFALASNGSSATASSGTAANAIDGNEGSRWESASTDDETWTLNMGQKRIFNTIRILWEGAYCKEYNLTYSNDGENWSPLYTETNLTSAGWQTIELGSNVTAQYIKYHGTLRATGWGQSFYEFQVLLPGVQTLTSITLSAGAAMAEVGGAGVALTAQPKDQNGQNMDAAVSWEITPAAAGHMSGNTFIPDQIGSASIRAYNGEVYSPAVTIVAYTGSNVALEKDVEASGYDDVNNLLPSFAVDNNEGSLWSARAGETGAEREYDAWIIVDLGAFYDINLIALRWEGACSRHYHVDFSADKSAWRTAYNAGWDAIATHWEYLSGTAEDNTKVRYVRVWSTEAVSQYGVKIMDLKVFGTEWVDSGDTENPVMTSASLVSSTSTSAVIAVAATDDHEVARYHVVDATNGIDANYIPEAGNITITGLTHATDYNFTITAIDAASHESENSIVVPVSTPFDVTINLALNKSCEAGYEDGNPAETAAKANDGDENSSWVTYADRPASEEWWYVDLGDIYAINNITTVWGDPCATNYILQARVEAPATADKADDAAWITLATVTDGAINSTKSTDVSGIGRYVRIHALARSANFFRLKELRVFGTGKVAADTEKPVMGAASLVSNTDSHAIISVAATDNTGIASFHVVDAGNSFDANFVAEAGQITVTGLTGGTNYTLVITAVDLFGNESENSKSVAVTTTAHYTAPQAACPAPTWDAALVKAMYSPTYEADYTHQDWGSGTVATKDEFGRKYVTNNNGYFGADGFNLNCLLMEKLHYDIWIENDATVRFVPIWGGAEQGITKALIGQQWNSIDIDLSEYTGITTWGSITLMKIDNAKNLTFWVANAYFYREAAYVDGEAPTSVSASLLSTTYVSASIQVSATDNSGAVLYVVKNGDEVVANGGGASDATVTIDVPNLTPGTNYNLNVIAKDDAGNEAAPVAVAANTLALPAAAPTPDLTGKLTADIFCDAIAGGPAINIGGWRQSTVATSIPFSATDNVFYFRNFNYLGFELAPAVDATDLTYLHVDIYAPTMASVGITPISPGHELSTVQSLTPGEWTSLDIPLSTYASANIEWNNVFQFKFDQGDGSGELFVDNVYFWKAPDYTRDAMVVAGELGTICLPNNVALANASGANFFELAGKNAEGKIVFDQVTTELEAGVPYVFQATANEINIFYGSTHVDNPVDAGNGMYGTFSQVVLSGSELNDVYYFAQKALWSCADLIANSETLTIPANRAYIKLSEIPDATPTPAPGRIRLTMNVNGAPAVVTGVEEITNDQSQMTNKVIIDGHLFILRGEKLYDATGRLVK